MELLSMMGGQSVRLWLVQSMVVFFLVGGVFLLAVGASLIVNSARTLQFFGRMNRWVSMRRASRSLEIPRDTRSAVQKYRYGLAAIFVAGGIFAIVGIAARFDTRAVMVLLGLSSLRPEVAVWLVDGIRWLLLVGNLTAIVAGVLLAFFPNTLVALETHGSHWVSQRRVTKGTETMHYTLDAWVAAHPRTAGGIMVFCAVGLIGAFGIILPRVW